MYYHTSLFVEMSLTNFLPGLASTLIFPISASQIATVPGSTTHFEKVKFTVYEYLSKDI
jgi:hypothetical protein